ncbi:MAG: FtsW/RodA/SpoVE family cell cycle protein, partial [Spirochaetales bacterium]
QPDTGTASVYVPIFLIMIFAAGLPLKYIILVTATSLLTIVFTILPVVQEEIFQNSIAFFRIFTDSGLRLIVIIALSAVTLITFVGLLLYKHKYYYWVTWTFGIITISFIASIFMAMVLKDYQIKRLIVFVNPNIDPLGSGWNIIQSKIAIGSGGLFGQGFLQGTQSHYRFLPQQSTDFIFSILSEEVGFVGVIFVFALYAVIFFRIIHIMRQVKNTFGYYITTGILGMFLFQFMVNVGVAMGMMPITGIPLFFLSYGGSSLWTAMIAIGLLMNIYYRRLNY